MKTRYSAIRGTQDVLPPDSYTLRSVENALINNAARYGFGEIRTPVFEQTELFDRGVGETTDVVEKEMYTFEDNGHRSITLRPEGTAGVVRAFIEHGLFNEPMPQRFSYITSCYRYEKPQTGRLREFHQFGVEYFGSSDAAADAEVISLARHSLDLFELDGIELRINSIGCKECRKDFQKALHDYFSENVGELCDTCKNRLDRNPMRILDCKNPSCHELGLKAPVVLDYLCGDCSAHFDALKSRLDDLDLGYTVDPRIVRGLDYYTRTVFEFVSSGIGTQGTVCGGGRYDGLCEQLGGPSVPALGFGMGLERLSMLLNDEKTGLKPYCKLFIAAADDKSKDFCVTLADRLRYEYAGFLDDAPCSFLYDTTGRSVKAQMKYAGRIGAEFTVVIGTDELQSGKVVLKKMADGTQTELSLDNFVYELQAYEMAQVSEG
ncbi:MAG: histidine--tRNA ligase [Clostridia bacterium]|nr:histidine--tRNA ligase [Clostridia bacterium]